MADLEQTETDPAIQLWDKLDEMDFVMLGSPKSSEHLQPMTPFVDRESGAIWFYVKTSNDLVAAVAHSDACVHLCAVASDYQACVKGNLVLEKNASVIERFWRPSVAAWFEGGKTDPMLTMLRFQPAEAAIWAKSGNPFKVAWENMRARLKDHTPNIGTTAAVDLE